MFFFEQNDIIQSQTHPATNAAIAMSCAAVRSGDDDATTSTADQCPPVVEGYTPPAPSIPAKPKKQFTIKEAWAREAYFNRLQLNA